MRPHECNYTILGYIMRLHKLTHGYMRLHRVIHKAINWVT